jgi:hypothetical protein
MDVSLPRLTTDNSTTTTGVTQPPLVEYSHCRQCSTATSDLHTLQTHTFLVSLPPHSRLTTDNSTATTRVTQPPLVEHSHRCWCSTATGDLCTNTFLANTFLTSIHAHNAWQIILLSTQPLLAYHSNCRQHSHWCQSNAATSAGAAQPPPVTCTYLFEQHLHGLHLCLQHFSNSHHCNASTSRAMQPPPELCSHHQSYAVTTRVAQPPPVIPILSFLLPLQHFQHTTNSYHCNPTTSGAAQPPVISPLPFPSPPQMFPTHLKGHTPNGDLN